MRLLTLKFLRQQRSFRFTHNKLNHAAPSLRLALAEVDHNSGTPQKRIYQAVVDKLYIPNDHIEVNACMQTRIRDLFHPYEVNFVQSVDPHFAGVFANRGQRAAISKNTSENGGPFLTVDPRKWRFMTLKWLMLKPP